MGYTVWNLNLDIELRLHTAHLNLGGLRHCFVTPFRGAGMVPGTWPGVASYRSSTFSLFLNLYISSSFLSHIYFYSFLKQIVPLHLKFIVWCHEIHKDNKMILLWSRIMYLLFHMIFVSHISLCWWREQINSTSLTKIPNIIKFSQLQSFCVLYT